MPACHAGGHEFESRTHRREVFRKGDFFVFYPFCPKEMKKNQELLVGLRNFL